MPKDKTASIHYIFLFMSFYPFFKFMIIVLSFLLIIKVIFLLCSREQLAKSFHFTVHFSFDNISSKRE